MVGVPPLPSVGGVFVDKRDPNRWLRVSWHAEDEMYVLSTWHVDTCVSAFQLATADLGPFLEMLLSPSSEPRLA
jgi:hypothetical protein